MIADFTTEIKNMFSLPGKYFAIARVDLELLRYNRQKADPGWPDMFLAPEERLRFAEFRLTKRQDEWLGGRIAVKAAYAFLWKQKKIAWQQTVITAADSGRPLLENIHPVKSQIFISLSHSNNLALGIAAFSACGIDIQEIRPAVCRVRERFSTRCERDILAQAQATAALEPEARLSLLWSGKEALMKTFDLSPLLFFSEINLQMIKSAGKGGVIFEFLCGRAGELESRQCRVFLTIIDNYAFACNRQETESNDK